MSKLSSIPDTVLLKAENIWAGYSQTSDASSQAHRESCVLHNVSLILEAGEIVGLLGPNGAGKSSLLLALSGLMPLREGQISVLGQDVHTLKARQRAQSLAVMPQRLDFLPPLTLEELVLLGRYAHSDFFGNYRSVDYAIVAQTLAQCGLQELAGTDLQRLSGGELQLGLLARALAQQTPLLLLDEATSALDLRHRLNIFELLLERKQQGVGILVAIHDLNLAALYCDRLIFLRAGQMFYQGNTQELFRPDILEEVYGVKAQLVYNAAGRPQAVFNPGDWRV